MPDSIEESVDVAPSADNGNLPVDAEVTPNEPTETPAPAPEVAEPSTPSAEPLYELPDGRKVDAATVLQEYKNLLPDYTRKSQELAAAKSGTAGDPSITTKPTSPFDDPNFVPQSYAELAEAIRQSTLAEIEQRGQQAEAERKAVEDAVSATLTELKTLDPNLNETALFQHAVKYSFRDLKAAYQNMSDMNKAIKDTKVATAADIRKRGDPVSASPGATGARVNPSNFASATDFLRAISGNK